MSEPQGDGQPGSSSSSGSSQPADSSQPTSSSSPGGNGQSGTRNRSSRGGDPVADFQRWLMKAGARSMANQVADQVKKTMGQERRDKGDVWDTATNELPPDEPLECQWCPVCQAARAARLGGPGFGARLADAGGVLASVVTDAFSAFEQVMKTQEQSRSAERTVVPPPPPPAPAPAPDREDTAP
ncbi:MAG: hypothetical protein ABSB76_24020 [Streptosporangiaceae bacterium]